MTPPPPPPPPADPHRLRSFTLIPNPCRHDRAGKPHATLGAVYRCVVRYGNPGVRLEEIAL